MQDSLTIFFHDWRFQEVRPMIFESLLLFPLYPRATEARDAGLARPASKMANDSYAQSLFSILKRVNGNSAHPLRRT